MAGGSRCGCGPCPAIMTERRRFDFEPAPRALAACSIVAAKWPSHNRTQGRPPCRRKFALMRNPRCSFCIECGHEFQPEFTAAETVFQEVGTALVAFAADVSAPPPPA